MGDSNTPSLLLLRVNAVNEVFATRDAPTLLRASLGAGLRIVTPITAATETRRLLEADPRLDVATLAPGPRAFMIRQLRGVVARERVRESVFCLREGSGLNYLPHYLAFLAVPGPKRVLLYPGTALHGPAAPRVLRALLASASAATAASAATRVTLKLAGAATRAYNAAARRRRPAPPRAPDAVADAEQRPVRRILWMPIDGLGDLVTSLPALRAVRARFPGAEVDILARRAYGSLATGLGLATGIMEFEPLGKPTRGRPATRGLAFLRLVLALRARRYDLAVDLAGKDIHRILAYASGAPRRVGARRSLYDRPGVDNLAGLLTDPVDLRPGAAHIAERGLEIAAACGASVALIPRAFERDPAGEARVAAALAERGVAEPLLLVQGASVVESKMWSVAGYSAVARHVLARYPHSVLLCGGPGDHAYNGALKAAIGSERVHDVAGLFPLADLPHLCALADGMLTIDTGPMHLAAAAGTPCVALYHPSTVQHTFPGDARALHGDAAVRYDHFPYAQPHGAVVGDAANEVAGYLAALDAPGSPLEAITADEVIAAVDRMLGSASRRVASAGALREVA